LQIKNCCFTDVRIPQAPWIIKIGPITWLYPSWLAFGPFALSFLLPFLIPPGAHLQASAKDRESNLLEKVNWIWNPPTFHPVPLTRKMEMTTQEFVQTTLSSFREHCLCQLWGTVCFIQLNICRYLFIQFSTSPHL